MKRERGEEPARRAVGLVGLILLAVPLLLAGCGEEAPAVGDAGSGGAIATTVDLTGVRVEVHKEPG